MWGSGVQHAARTAAPAPKRVGGSPGGASLTLMSKHQRPANRALVGLGGVAPRTALHAGILLEWNEVESKAQPEPDARSACQVKRDARTQCGAPLSFRAHPAFSGMNRCPRRAAGVQGDGGRDWSSAKCRTPIYLPVRIPRSYPRVLGYERGNGKVYCASVAVRLLNVVNDRRLSSGHLG